MPDGTSNSRFAGFIWNALPRGLALFLGGFSLLNFLGNFRSAGFDANLWWIDLRFLPEAVANSFLVLSALCLLGFGFRPPTSVWRRCLTQGVVGLLMLGSLANTAQFYVLLARRALHAGNLIPFSLLISGSLALIFFSNLRPRWLTTGPKQLLPSIAVSLGCLVLFPMAQMFCFGKTDYRRPADVAVVLGARVYEDGRPSDALADRVRTGCALYREGFAKKLLLSGGPGDGPVHETASMKRLAIQLGVKPEDIVVDLAGVNTQATVKNSEAVFAKLHASRILVVSHFYHLPRIKLAYQREGIPVFTVPAKESYFLRQMPFNMAREVAALWVYYLRPLTGHSTPAALASSLSSAQLKASFPPDSASL